MATTIQARDIQQRHILTELIKASLHEDDSVGAKIAPLQSINTRKFKVAVRKYTEANYGQFKATNANTPIFKGGGTVEEILETLVDLEEMEVIDADELIRLESPDDAVAVAAMRNITEISKELAIRNRNLTRYMRWQAFQDGLTITFSDGGAYDVDYDLDNSDDGMSATHVVTASVDWDTPATADPLTDVRTWVDLIGTDLGYDGRWLHMNKNTWRTMQQIDQLEGYLLDHYGPLKIPNKAAVKEILDLDGGIIVENGYYKDTSGDRHYYIPEGYCMLTSDYRVDSAPIAGVYDGPVVLYDPASGQNRVQNNPGLQVEIFADPMSKATYVRLGTARMVWMRREAFVWAKVYTA